MTSGVFTPGGLPSLVALNPGSNTFGLLSGLGDGRLSNAAIFPTPAAPLVIRAVDFNGDGLSGLAILTSGGLYIERSNGRGGFLPPTEIDVGFEPNGLTVADLNGDGKADLLVSNPLGDILVLLGNGDGTFRTPRSVDQQVSLAVEGPSGTTPSAFIFADQLTDQVIVQTVGGGTTVLADTSTGLVSPGAVKLADLNGDGIPDLIVADSGSNDVLVYPGLGNGTFGPALNDGHGFFTGTNPVGITVADVNGDGRPDLVIANKGSNTVSILINEKVGNSFTFVPGPVLQAGDGPVATVLGNVAGSPLPDLLVADSSSNQVLLLEGIGNGFFNDQEPTIYQVGTDPSALYLGQFTGGPGQSLATINSGSNTVTLISGLGVGVARDPVDLQRRPRPHGGPHCDPPGERPGEPDGRQQRRWEHLAADRRREWARPVVGRVIGRRPQSVRAGAVRLQRRRTRILRDQRGRGLRHSPRFSARGIGRGHPDRFAVDRARGLCIGERLGPARLPERVVAGPGRHPVDDLAQLAVRDGGVGGGFGIGSRRVRFGSARPARARPGRWAA